jgi:hypothetical protein
MKDMKNKKLALFAVFSEIPLGIDCSNLGNRGWLPSVSDGEIMGAGLYKTLVEQYEAKNSKVLFENTRLKTDSCDCGGDLGCSHEDYVYEIEVIDGNKKYLIDMVDGEFFTFEGKSNYVQIPIEGVTAYDFYRACELCGIKLKLTSYALSLLDGEKKSAASEK